MYYIFKIKKINKVKINKRTSKLNLSKKKTAKRKALYKKVVQKKKKTKICFINNNSGLNKKGHLKLGGKKLQQ